MTESEKVVSDVQTAGNWTTYTIIMTRITVASVVQFPAIWMSLTTLSLSAIQLQANSYLLEANVTSFFVCTCMCIQYFHGHYHIVNLRALSTSNSGTCMHTTSLSGLCRYCTYPVTKWYLDVIFVLGLRMGPSNLGKLKLEAGRVQCWSHLLRDPASFKTHHLWVTA